VKVDGLTIGVVVTVRCILSQMHVSKCKVRCGRNPQNDSVAVTRNDREQIRWRL
jgi:hypothetical protein